MFYDLMDETVIIENNEKRECSSSRHEIEIEYTLNTD